MVFFSVIDIAKKIADKCVDPIVGYIGTEVGHLWNYSANLKKLEEEVDHLNDATRRMEDRIEDAGNRSGETRVDAGAERWLTKMARLSEEASRIIKEEERETGRCLMGLRPNLWACYLASKSAKKVMDDADELKKDGESITTVARNDYSQALGFEIIPDFEELESRKRASEQIVAYLKDPSVKMVGMYGMGGTGKTTLAEKIGVQLYEDGTFKYVVKTVVSNNQSTDLIDIQKQIADLLKISLRDDKDDVMARAKQLREQLVKKDKVLIILDDIWSRFELRDVGIPLDGELKVLITSRDVNVMNEIDSKHNVPLDALSPEDSWKLFDRMANGVAQYSDRYSTALDLVKQCGGIPVLLVAIAKALRNEDLETWKEASLQLKRFEGDNFVEDGYKRLEVSYNFLPNNELKSLFLLCAQLEHRFIPIDDLLRYSMGLGLFDKRETLSEVRGRLHMHLGRLKGYCLLQDGNREGTVRMHDVVHKFAASVANRDRGISRTIAEAQLQECPSKDKVEQFSISLPHRHLPPPDHQLLVAFDSSKLESFLLLRSEDDAFLNVPDKFFIGMKELKLIDIRRMHLSLVLLSSLNVLVKLRTLCLDYCELGDIAVIGDLPMLQVLSLKGSSVSEIRRLGSSLKLLDLRYCRHLEVIASGVFCNLTLLEDLRIGTSFDQWEPLQGCNSGSDHETSTTKRLASLREFNNLGNLVNLEIQILDPKTFPKDLVFAKLERFKVLIGYQDQYSQFLNDTETLVLKLVEDIQLYEGIKVLMRKAKKLDLEEIQGVTSVCELLDMRELERMCDDHLMLPVGSLQNLTSIHVSRCNVLKYLFSSHLALRGLLCLEEIRVEDCKSMETIVSRVSENRITVDNQLDEEEEEIIEFTQLRKLTLSGLDHFISFYSSNTPNPIISSSQKRQKQDLISSNQRLPTSLFNKKVVLPNLEELQLWFMDVDQIWDDQLAIEAQRRNCSFQNLTILGVLGCDNLNYLFTSSMVRSLLQLEMLDVKFCAIEEIVATKGEMTGDEEEIIEFTQLRTLQLSGLDRFISFYSSSTPNPIISSSQEKQEHDPMSSSENEIVEDPMSSNQRLPISIFNKKVVLPKLEELYLQHMFVDQIWDDQLAIEVQRINCWFQNLTNLIVHNCNNLRYLFTFSMVKNFVQLNRLDVQYCESIEEIVTTKGEMAGDQDDVMFPFPALNTLELRNLPILKRFCHDVNFLEWRSLGWLGIYECPKLMSFYSSSTPNPIISSSQEREEHDPVSSSENEIVEENQRLPTSLFNKKVVLPKLEDLGFSGITVDQIWDDQLAIEAQRINCWFQNLTSLTVWRCDNLSYLFTSSMVKSFAQLEWLQVEECKSIEEIVATKGEMAGDQDDVVLPFPALDILVLKSLPILKRFYHDANFFECRFLDTLKIEDCPKLIR